MLSTSRRAGLLIAGIAAAQGVSVLGQESLRNALDFDRIDAQRQQSVKNQDYNLKLGPVLMTAGAGMTVTYNDNINVSATNPEEDVVLRPGANIGIVWPMTAHNQLSLNTSIGYNKYINHPENDRMSLSPGALSDISYDVFVGTVRFNLHDRFTYTQDPLGYGSGAVAGEADLGRFYNAAGVTTMLRLRDTDVTLGYDHGNMIFFNDTFSNSTYSSDMLFLRVGHKWNPTLTIGGELSAGMTDYEEGFRSDNRNWTAGPFMQWRLTSLITMEARGGVSGYSLESTGALGDTAAPLSFYASIELQHQIHAQVAHTISLGRDTSQGIGISANFLETMYVRHSATWRIISSVSLSTQLFYEETANSGEGAGAFLAESYSRYGGGISLGYQFLRQVSSSLSYMHTEKASSLTGFDYSVNSVTLGLQYRF